PAGAAISCRSSTKSAMRSRVSDTGPLSKCVEYVLSSLRSDAGGSFLRALEVGDESVVVRTPYDLHEFVSVLAPLIEDLLRRMDDERHGDVFPLGHDSPR